MNTPCDKSAKSQLQKMKDKLEVSRSVAIVTGSRSGTDKAITVRPTDEFSTVGGAAQGRAELCAQEL
jgi:hypothetical protein